MRCFGELLGSEESQVCDALPPALACDEKLPPDQAGLGAALASPFPDPLPALKPLRVALCPAVFMTGCLCL